MAFHPAVFRRPPHHIPSGPLYIRAEGPFGSIYIFDSRKDQASWHKNRI